MILASKIYGNIEYKEDEVIVFNKGVLGFENLKRYILINLKEYEPFQLLQCIDDENIGFIVAYPFDFYKDYEFKLTSNQIERLKIKKQDQVLVFNILTLKEDPNKITINLKAPIIINTLGNLGEQIVLDNEEYKIKQPLIKEC